MTGGRTEVSVGRADSRVAVSCCLGLVLVLAGCSAMLPAKTPPADLPERAPQLVCEEAWHEDNGTVTVRIVQGPTYRPEPSEVLELHVEYGDGPVRWVAGDDWSNDRQDTPIGPGDAITVAVSPQTEDVRLVWTTGESSAQLCHLERPAEDEA